MKNSNYITYFIFFFILLIIIIYLKNDYNNLVTENFYNKNTEKEEYFSEEESEEYDEYNILKKFNLYLEQLNLLSKHKRYLLKKKDTELKKDKKLLDKIEKKFPTINCQYTKEGCCADGTTQALSFNDPCKGSNYKDEKKDEKKSNMVTQSLNCQCNMPNNIINKSDKINLKKNKSRHSHNHNLKSDKQYKNNPIKPRNKNIDPREPRHHDIDNREPRHPGIDNRKPRHHDIDNREPRHPGIDNRKPRHPGIDNRKPRHHDIDNRKPRHPDIDNRKPRHPDIDNREPRHPDIDPREPRHPDIDNREPRHPDIDNRKPRHPDIDPREPRHPDINYRNYHKDLNNLNEQSQKNTNFPYPNKFLAEICRIDNYYNKNDKPDKDINFKNDRVDDNNMEVINNNLDINPNDKINRNISRNYINNHFLSNNKDLDYNEYETNIEENNLNNNLNNNTHLYPNLNYNNNSNNYKYPHYKNSNNYNYYKNPNNYNYPYYNYNNFPYNLGIHPHQYNPYYPYSYPLNKKSKTNKSKKKHKKGIPSNYYHNIKVPYEEDYIEKKPRKKEKKEEKEEKPIVISLVNDRNINSNTDMPKFDDLEDCDEQILIPKKSSLVISKNENSTGEDNDEYIEPVKLNDYNTVYQNKSGKDCYINKEDLAPKKKKNQNTGNQNKIFKFKSIIDNPIYHKKNFFTDCVKSENGKKSSRAYARFIIDTNKNILYYQIKIISLTSELVIVQINKDINNIYLSLCNIPSENLGNTLSISENFKKIYGLSNLHKCVKSENGKIEGKINLVINNDLGFNNINQVIQAFKNGEMTITIHSCRYQGGEISGLIDYIN